MNIEKTKNEIVFRLPADFDTASLQRILNYIKFKEATLNSKAEIDAVNRLANQSKKKWWSENKSKYIK